MLKLSVILLFLSSMFLLNLFRVCQTGVYWEVSPHNVQTMLSSNLMAILFFVVAILFFLLKINIFMEKSLLDKILFFGWSILIIIALAIIFRHGGPVDAFRLNSAWRPKSDVFFGWGLGVSLGLFIRLLLVL